MSRSNSNVTEHGNIVKISSEVKIRQFGVKRFKPTCFTLPCVVRRAANVTLRAYSHQAKAGAKAKKIKGQEKKFTE